MLKVPQTISHRAVGVTTILRLSFQVGSPATNLEGPGKTQHPSLPPQLAHQPRGQFDLNFIAQFRAYPATSVHDQRA